MSSLVMVTLRDGSQVPEATLITTTVKLNEAFEESFVALVDLAKKCKNASHKFIRNPFGDSKAILKKLILIDESEEVYDDVRKIVLNSIEGEGLSLRLVNPLMRARL